MAVRMATPFPVSTAVLIFIVEVTFSEIFISVCSLRTVMYNRVSIEEFFCEYIGIKTEAGIVIFYCRIFNGYFRAAEENVSVKKITYENGKSVGYMKLA
jgi:hypothetical protein